MQNEWLGYVELHHLITLTNFRSDWLWVWVNKGDQILPVVVLLIHNANFLNINHNTNTSSNSVMIHYVWKVISTPGNIFWNSTALWKINLIVIKTPLITSIIISFITNVFLIWILKGYLYTICTWLMIYQLNTLHWLLFFNHEQR